METTKEKVLEGEEVDSTKKVVKSALEDTVEGLKDLIDLDL